MPISTQCPKCQKLYKLKDELLGKRVTCATQSCRTLFEVKPYIPPGSKQHPKLDAEAVAAAAFKDELDPAEAIPEDQRKITMACNICEHKFEVAWSLQGKNTICPECKARQKVPEQKGKNEKVDWKNLNKNRPSMAKQEEVPDDVWGANKANVSVGSLKEAGAIKGVEYEPRPMSFWIKIGSAVAIVLAVAIGSIVYMSKSKQEQSQLKLIDDATSDFATFKDAGVLPAYAPQFKALNSLILAEYHARQNTAADIKLATQHLATGRQAVAGGDARGGDREMILTELMSTTLSLAGDSDQVKGGGKLPWIPVENVKRSGLKVSDQNIVLELQTLFQDMQFADPDWRFATLRRIVRELEAKGQGSLASSLINSGFKTEEQLEAGAIVAIEQARIANSTTKAAEDAVQLKDQVDPMAENLPAAAYALWIATNTAGAPKPPVAPAGSPSLPSRMTYVWVKLMQNQPAEALAIAKMPGNADDRLKAVALIAETYPAEAIPAAVEIVASKPMVPNSVYARLAKAAGSIGNDPAVEAIVNAIPDEGVKAWAKGDALRAKILSNPTTRADDGQSTTEEPKKIRAGAAWAKFVTMRQNAKLGLNSTAEAKALPSGTLRPFALMGIVLGTQDKAGK